MGTQDYDKLVKDTDKHGHLLKVAPEHFVKLVQSAVDYSQALGFGRREQMAQLSGPREVRRMNECALFVWHVLNRRARLHP